jgi:hypothetical protein
MRLMGLAYEMTRKSLRLVDRGNIANNVVAQKIIELAKGGERDPELLCEAVLKKWRVDIPQDAVPQAASA